METKQTLRMKLETQIQQMVIESAKLLEEVQWEFKDPDIDEITKTLKQMTLKIKSLEKLLGE